MKRPALSKGGPDRELARRGGNAGPGSTESGRGMSRRNKKTKRSDADYLQSAKTLSTVAPALKKYKRRKKLTRWEKGAITRKEKAVKYADNLIPVADKNKKKFKKFFYAPGVQAIQMRNTGRNVTIQAFQDDILVTSNGRTWLYWSLDNVRPAGMTKAAETVFGVRGAFPLEQILELASRAFSKPQTLAVGLWTAQGRVGEPFPSMRQFLEWITLQYSSYVDVEKWVNGIAIMVSDAGENIGRRDIRRIWYGEH